MTDTPTPAAVPEPVAWTDADEMKALPDGHALMWPRDSGLSVPDPKPLYSEVQMRALADRLAECEAWTNKIIEFFVKHGMLDKRDEYSLDDVMGALRDNYEPSETPALPEPVAYRCFHCQGVFTDDRHAALHFGSSEISEPACLIKAGAEGSMLEALRRAEADAQDAIHKMHDESAEGWRAYHNVAGRVREQVEAAENLGFERGMRDSEAQLQALADRATVAEAALAGARDAHLSIVKDYEARATTAEAALAGAHNAALDKAAQALAAAPYSKPSDVEETGFFSIPTTREDMIAIVLTLKKETT